MNSLVGLLAAVALPAALAACGDAGSVRDGRTVVRVGHFPNVTHAQALVARGLAREGRDWFAERLPPDVRVEWFAYRAGPGAIEGLFARTIDLTYVGPGPAINAHAKAKGTDIHVVAGAARGGAALVVQGDGRIARPEDFRGRRVATPQLGNTQDVACRTWLVAHGFRITQTGGDVLVLPTQNADQLALFRKGDLDAVWTVEPWVSRLETEAGGRVMVEETGSVTTVLAASGRFLRTQPELARKFVQAHAELTAWITANPAEAQRIVRAELAAETRQTMSAELIGRAWSRIRFDAALDADALAAFAHDARASGFLSDANDLSRLVRQP